MELIGRQEELKQIEACLQLGKNVLLEGPVGVGKTVLAREALRKLKKKTFRVDGDQRFSEQKLTGWFDPPMVLKKGFVRETFLPGPLVEAMESMGVLFINELNRLPDGVQNVLLPAIDERIVSIPKLGEIRTSSDFCVVATQNPKEFVATSHLSEAILDRFELIRLAYQTAEEEEGIVQAQTGCKDVGLIERAVSLVRKTREDSSIRRGASVRAAISIVELAEKIKDFEKAVQLALPTRIELERDVSFESWLSDQLQKKK